MSIPTDKPLYDRIKRRIYKKQPKHSAYRSGLIVKEYKAAFKKNTVIKHHIKVRKRRADCVDGSKRTGGRRMVRKHIVKRGIYSVPLKE